MATIRILSIDFDYFINTTIDVRNNKFPNGCDEAPKEYLEQLWNEAYTNYPEIKEIGVTRSYITLKHFLSKHNKHAHSLSADSHKEIKLLLDMVDKNDTLEVYNIDFHHDMYHAFFGGNEYNCGNWARRLTEDNPNAKYVWIKRRDSDTQTLIGEVPCKRLSYLRSALNGMTFDAIFLCKSPEWTPPHLYPFYEELKRILKN